mmetsp:Transcript_49848/g.79507  ORF Transcript_49848/g.79507 Transcript_49848/m.79507 type:complete len:699 (+) Transcript_49848:78-2174(+)
MTLTRAMAPLLLLCALEVHMALCEEGITYDRTCFLGSSFKDGTCGSSPVETPPPCPNTGACVERTSDTHSESYCDKVTDSESFKNSLSSVTDVQGSGWGASVSAGVKYMQESISTSLGMSFVISHGEMGQADSVRYVEKLRLLPGALDLLRKDPLDFLEAYGSFYVYRIVYGASFLASMNLRQTTSTDSSSLSAFAEFTAEKVFFNAKASEQFDQASKNSQSSLHISGKILADGPPLEVDGAQVEAIGETYNKWQKRLHGDKPPLKPMLMYLRRWYDLEQVQEVVNNLNESQPGEMKDIIGFFVNKPPGDSVLRLLTEEQALSRQALLDVESTDKTMWCAKRQHQAELDQLKRDLISRESILKKLSLRDLYKMEKEVKAGDFNSFPAWQGIYRDRLQHLLSTPTPGPPRLLLLRAFPRFALTVENGGAKREGKVHMWHITRGEDQVWQLYPDGTIRLQSFPHKALSVRDGDSLRNGGKVWMWDITCDRLQRWQLHSDSTLRLEEFPHFALSQENEGAKDGGVVQMWNADLPGLKNRMWFADLVPVQGKPMWLRLKSFKNFALTVDSGGARVNGGRVWVRTFNRSILSYGVQLWQWYSDGTIRLFAFPSKALSIEDGGAKNGGRVQIWDVTRDQNQRWQWGPDGTLRLQAFPDFALCIGHGEAKDHGIVQMWNPSPLGAAGLEDRQWFEWTDEEAAIVV